jgi:hypothetical protein
MWFDMPRRSLSVANARLLNKDMAQQIVRLTYARMWDASVGLLTTSLLTLSLLWTLQSVARLQDWVRDNKAIRELLPGSSAILTQWNQLIVAHPWLDQWKWFAVLLIVLLILSLSRHLAVLLFSWRDIQPLRQLERKVARND